MAQKKRRRAESTIGKKVGMLIVLLLAAYFIFKFLDLKKTSDIRFYEVEEGSLVKEHVYTGLILRNEIPFAAQANGYVNFYVADARKVAMGSRVYSIDESGDLKSFLEQHQEEVNQLSSSKVASIRSTVMEASRSFDPVSFRTTTELKDELNTAMLEYTDTDALSELTDQLKASGFSFVEYRTDMTGIVSYLIDGYESLTRSELSSDCFDRNTYQGRRVKSGDLVTEGDQVYKLVRDELWEIIFQMNEDDIAEFSDKSSLKVSFSDKNIETNAEFSMFKGSDGSTYGALSLKRYLIQFVSDRYVDFEIVTNDVSGLKIPEKSITEKDFYLVPSSYKKTDSSDNTGFYKESLTDGGTTNTFILTDVYYDDGEYAYVALPSSGSLSEGDYITDPDVPGSRYQIGPVKPLPGVYNINKGYTVFKRIEEQERANGYAIVKKNTSYGLALYDHIVLDAATVTEGQVLY